MSETATAAPKFIAADTYSGRWTVTRKDATQLGCRTAGWLAEQIGEGNTAVVWEFFGHTRTERLLFGRTRFVAVGGQLYGYDSDGALKIIHPADRNVRFLSA